MLSLDDIYLRYSEPQGKRTVLRGVSMAIQAGECVALLGRSGSGKSSLLNIIAGIDQPTRGRVRIQGTELTGLDERSRTLYRRRHIGFVYQFFNLLPTLTVRENVLLPLDLLNEGRGPRARRALELLDELGLAERSDSYPDRLSGGEQQRVALIRALAHDPPLVLADEPTGNLDLETGSQVLGLMERLVRRRGNTLVIVTHSTEVAQFADRRMRLEAGRIHRA